MLVFLNSQTFLCPFFSIDWEIIAKFYARKKILSFHQSLITLSNYNLTL
jgi:hypothetical protein